MNQQPIETTDQPEQPQQPQGPEPNFVLSGDEARFLMRVMLGSGETAQTGPVLGLYLRLSGISQVQPAVQPEG